MTTGSGSDNSGRCARFKRWRPSRSLGDSPVTRGGHLLRTEARVPRVHEEAREDRSPWSGESVGGGGRRSSGSPGPRRGPTTLCAPLRFALSEERLKLPGGDRFKESEGWAW